MKKTFPDLMGLAANSAVVLSSVPLSGSPYGYTQGYLTNNSFGNFLAGAFPNFGDAPYFAPSWGPPFFQLAQNASWELVTTDPGVSGGSAHPTYAEQTLSWKEVLIQVIDDYRNRTPGWDGYEARPISSTAIEDAQQFIISLPDSIERPRDQPCSDGEVSLVWRKGKRFAEVSFPGDGTFYWYATDEERSGSDEGIPVRRGLPLHLQDIMGLRPANAGKLPSSIPPVRYNATAYVSASG